MIYFASCRTHKIYSNKPKPISSSDSSFSSSFSSTASAVAAPEEAAAGAAAVTKASGLDKISLIYNKRIDKLFERKVFGKIKSVLYKSTGVTQ